MGILIPYLVRVITNKSVDFRINSSMLKGIELGEQFNSSHFKGILGLVGLLLFFALAKGVFMFYMRQGVIKISRKIEYDLKNDIFKHYLNLSPTFYLKNYTGDLMNRISEDVSRAREYLGPAIMYTTNLTFTFSFVFYMMFNVNAKLSLLVLLPVPILAILIYHVSRIIHKKSSRIEAVLSEITVSAQETFSGIRVIKSFAQETFFKDKFNDLGERYKDENISLVKTQSLFMPLMVGLIGVSNVIVIYFGSKGVIEGTFTYGNIAEFIIYVNMLTWPVASLGWVTALVQRAAASQKRINEFLNTKSELNHGDTDAQFNHSLSLKDVSYHYSPNSPEILKNINLEIKKGEKVAIIGKTGSGKSTLLNLIAHLYDSSSGHLTIDHKPYSSLSPESFRKVITYIPQETFLFSDTIARNVDLYRTSSKGMKDVEKVLEEASVLHSFKDFKEGLNTVIGERGVTLSGGQKQRLAIARGLFKKSEIILLDDVFSALDMQTEQTVINNLKKIKDITLIISTNRMAVLNQMDRVAILKEGKILVCEDLQYIQENFSQELEDILKNQEVQEVIT